MELNWSTFILEIINFLVLVWILKRFLYRPVLDMIARRRAAIENGLQEADRRQADADVLKQQYEHRLADWEQERRKALDELEKELDEKRRDRLQKLNLELAEQEKKNQVAEARQHRQAMLEMEQQALRQGASFASRLLSEAAGPELEQRLFELLLKQLDELTDDQVAELAAEWSEAPAYFLVQSAYPLSDEQQQRLQQSLGRITGLSIPVRYERQADLIAGLSIVVGVWVLKLNLRDELRGFTEFIHVEQ